MRRRTSSRTAGEVLGQLLGGEGGLADDECQVGVLVDAELDTTTLDVCDGLRDVHGHGAGLGVRHEATGAQDAAEAADLAHEVGGSNGDVEVGVALGDLLDELVAADLVGACGDRFLSARTNGEDEDAGGLAGAVRQGHGAADHLVRLAGVDTESEDDLNGRVELGDGGLLGQVQLASSGGVELTSAWILATAALYALLRLVICFFSLQLWSRAARSATSYGGDLQVLCRKIYGAS